ncbi:MAG: hypothetical protein A2381_13135 [Bdellovibrionales bacterium RIFOXYB1_FULL_37_110]|nr:MAG: hypothetical protein A2181_02460 [Bdellovibrionales bacterium RIFOXYA1_FULL_38_20]OFZ51698.1 MAG: hypothetical protein A2417_12795 [Bdellovibrionales bacterium RIFOXYC1_FULL_37_79]OFZ60530.1 MAG: hypothetical protein A2381_13135 [Bdellovibrionales bacterium RIFOXYB1_FULL_37_110]OFZ65103.1 MAG: hypothetical protein A2577_09400 [Bdellovibrionales bacterium RIFOXYD1_FULL_36_51]
MAGAKKRKIKVMIVDDSSPVRKLVRKMIESNSDFEVVAEAENPLIAQNLINKNRPDVMTLDINMPGMDGVTFLKKMMKADPIPTIMVTSFSFDDSGPVFQALEEGAVDYIQKPNFSEIASVSEELCEKLKAAFLAKNKIKKIISNVSKVEIKLNPVLLNNWLVGIGSSTGGTEALKELLVRLPSNIPPILIVQHIPPVFSKAFADRMNAICAFEVKEAKDGDELKSGKVLLAPGGKQMRVKSLSNRLVVEITDDPPLNRFKPSVDYLFSSLGSIKKKKMIGILLTGMGADGARGLLALKENGAFTIGQDEMSSVVYGMPKVAYEIGAVDKQVSLLDIPKELSERLV